jgi:hypothetical protein
MANSVYDAGNGYYYLMDSNGHFVVGANGRPVNVDATGTRLDTQDSPNVTDTNKDPNRPEAWKGGRRDDAWMPPQFKQTYGNYTGLFPSMGQQVGQALYGSIQPQNYLPSWFQGTLPPRLNAPVKMQSYYGNNPALANQFPGGASQQPFGIQPTGNPNPPSGVPGSFSRTTMGNPYPLNQAIQYGRSNVPQVTHATNPFIGAYAGLSGYNPGQQQVGQPPSVIPKLASPGGTQPDNFNPGPGQNPPPPNQTAGAGGGGGPSYYDVPDGGGVINLTGGGGPPTWQTPPASGPNMQTKAYSPNNPYAGMYRNPQADAWEQQQGGPQMLPGTGGDVSLPSNGYGAGTAAGYHLDTAPNTTDPGSMLGLLGFLGGGNFPSSAAAYANWYQQTYGKQAPAPAPKAYP